MEHWSLMTLYEMVSMHYSNSNELRTTLRQRTNNLQYGEERRYCGLVRKGRLQRHVKTTILPGHRTAGERIVRRMKMMKTVLHVVPTVPILITVASPKIPRKSQPRIPDQSVLPVHHPLLNDPLKLLNHVLLQSGIPANPILQKLNPDSSSLTLRNPKLRMEQASTRK
jgi:hypothetical protein